MTIEPERIAQYARRADVKSSVWYLGCLFTVLADSQETGGRFGLIESLSPKGTEPPRHVHSREDEAFYLLEGEIPAAEVHELTQQLPALTHGEGVLESAFGRYQPVSGPIPTRTRSDHDPLDRKQYLLRVVRRRREG